MIVGRKKEQALLERAFKTKKNRFITVYGRRRVGKTFLINEFFKKKDCVFFHVSGLQHGSRIQQLENFIEKLSNTFLEGAYIKTPNNWKEAFKLLSSLIKKADKKVVLFFDELQWMNTKKSGLLTTIDYFWNNEWLQLNHIVFIACGSSVSWILKNIIYDTGGLHNRTNIEINLLPFNLAETKEFLKSMQVKLNDQHILSLYMALGGIPYYLENVSIGLTAQQNIQRLFFNQNAPLKNEYYKLFESLFDDADYYKGLIEEIAKKRKGIALANLSNYEAKSGGLLSERLQRLCDAGFIEKYIPWGKKRGAYYKVIDEFCLFYIQWIKDSPLQKFLPDHWIEMSKTPKYHAWSGYAFEAVCAKHTLEIVRALPITSGSGISSWRYHPKNNSSRGAQIDLIILRGDNAINLCEIKYTEKPFAIDKSYAAVLNNKISVFKEQTKTTKQLFLSMISASGLKPTLYSEEMVSGVVTLEDLFKTYG